MPRFTRKGHRHEAILGIARENPTDGTRTVAALPNPNSKPQGDCAITEVLLADVDSGDAVTARSVFGRT